jgi:hypothetical protein
MMKPKAITNKAQKLASSLEASKNWQETVKSVGRNQSKPWVRKDSVSSAEEL